MSRWGLTYKGVEPLFTDEWNTVVDALEFLDKRIKCGQAVFNGDGSKTTFQIEHGFTEKPTSAIVGKAIENLPDIDYWTIDETYISVTFKTAPPSGAGNVKIWWIAVKQ